MTPCYFSKSLSDFEMRDTLMVITAGRDSGVGSRSKPKLWTSPCSAYERNPFRSGLSKEFADDDVTIREPIRSDEDSYRTK
ncbi:hypothetical protein LXL04_010022 [Taraxacum kok-saghyz]